MKIGGPIEAQRNSRSQKCLLKFPPMKIGGPIEASLPRSPFGIGDKISADENRRPH